MIRLFDKLEDRVRYYLSRRPRLYAFISGVAIVLFWRGVWDMADLVQLSAFFSVLLSVIVMLLTGTFVSFFIGGKLLISGLKEEKRLDEKTVEEIQEEEAEIVSLRKAISEIHKDLASIKSSLK